jgi:hypothetical protein
MLPNFAIRKQAMKVLHRIGMVSVIIFAFAAASAKANARDYYDVVGVQNYLQVHRHPGEDSYVLARIPPNASEIPGFPYRSEWVDGQEWILIEWNGIRGYVNRSYLEDSY